MTALQFVDPWSLDAFDFRRVSSPATLLPKWRSALGKVKGGVRNAIIACYGDSTTAGEGGTNNGRNSNAISQSWPTHLAKALNVGAYPPASWQSMFGTHNAGAQFAGLDTRVVLGTDWAQSSFVSFGGNLIQCPSPNTGALAITPVGAFDTIEVWAFANTGNGQMTVNVDGGASLGTIDSNQTAGTFLKTTLTCSLGAHTINIARASGGTCYVVGVRVYTAATKEVSVINAGVCTAKAADLSNTPVQAYRSILGLQAVAPDLTIINLTINDWLAATDVTAYKASLQAIVTAAKISGDVIMVSGAPSNITQASVAQQQVYIDACRDVAVANQVLFLSVTDRWVSYAAATANAMYYDNLHPREAGYADMAQMLVPLLGA